MVFVGLGAALVMGTLSASAVRADDAKLALGKEVFTKIAEPACALCHTLADAGSQADIGPILDVLQPTAERVKAAVTQGIGPMPANEVLTPEQVDAVALYVSTVAGKSKAK